MGNTIDLQKLKKSLTIDEIITILKSIEPELNYILTEHGMILPTLCHNKYIVDASLKLYYYTNDANNSQPIFYCYTECSEAFDIFELIKRMLTLRNLPNNFYDVLNIISRFSSYNFEIESTPGYSSILSNYEKQKLDVQLPKYDKNKINVFKKYAYQSWIEEGITKKSMMKYNIRFSITNNQIIIPHYDVDNELVGIRARNLDELELLKGKKYMPIYLEGQWYSHSLSYNLYGLNINKEAIQRKKIAWVFEGEKSILHCDSIYDNENISVATCGNKLNKIQLNLLRNLGVNHIVLCYDRMNSEDNKYYFDQLYSICNKYKNYMNFSFIYDRDYLLSYKSAPIDHGQDIFEQLLKKRIIL